MRRILTRTGLLLAVVVALTGCMKVDQELKVRKDGKVDGTAIIAFDKAFVDMLDSMGQKGEFEKQMKNPEQPKDLPAGATAKVSYYKSGDWIGSKIVFKGMPADKLDDLDTTSGAATGSSSSDSQDFKLKKVGGNWQFSGVMDLSESAGSTGTTVKGAKGKATTTTAAPFDMSGLFENMKAEIRIKITFPGKVIKANGKVSGNSVTWTPKMGQRTVMSATAKG